APVRVMRPFTADAHVPAQCSLIVKYIATRLRVLGEYLLQHLAHGRPSGFRCRASDVTLDIGRKDDLGHQLRSVWLLPFSLADPRTNGRTARRQRRGTFFSGTLEGGCRSRTARGAAASD